MATIFTKIINREVSGHIVAEDEKNVAILDISPLVTGHTLVIPKNEVDYIFDLSDEDYVSLQLFAKKVAKALKESIPCIRIGEAVVGLEVPHTHVHLIPLNSMGDINFARPKLSPTEEELEKCAQLIRANFDK